MMQIEIDGELALNPHQNPQADAKAAVKRKVRPHKMGVIKPSAAAEYTDTRQDQPVRQTRLPVINQCSRIRSLRRSDTWLWVEILGGTLALAVIVYTAFMMWGDMDGRQHQRIAQAWSTAITPAPGNSGKGPALEFLVSNGVSLTGIDLSTKSNESATYLIGANLSGADLAQADLTKADLEDANLSGADLRYAFLENTFMVGADLSQANLERALFTQTNLLYANLSGANLNETNLSEATLAKANLTGAIVTGANFSGADLSDAILDGVDLSSACGNELTILPEGVTLPAC